MKHNPFLQSNNSNNRFSSLQDDDNSLFKDTSNKPRKQFETSNTFTYTDRPKYTDSYKNNRQNIHFKPKLETPSAIYVDTNNTELFPELGTSISTIENTHNSIKPSKNFKHILTNIIDNNDQKTNSIIPVSPGWVRISSVNRQTVFEHSFHSPFINYQYNKELERPNPNETNFSMSNAIESMKKNWEQYEKEYNDKNGEGAYADTFCLQPLYENENEDEDNTEDKDDNSEETSIN